MDDLVTVDLDDRVAIVTINNPKARNALSRELIVQLSSKLEGLMSSSDCRCVVLTGAQGTFSSGGDISRMTADRQILDSRIWLKTAHRLVRAIVDAEKPVLAAVEGYAFGAGLSLATASDLVVAADNAKFCAAFARVGLVPDMGLFFTLAQRVGAPQAKRLIMLAEVVEARRAQELGIVDAIVPPGEALTQAKAAGQTICGGSTATAGPYEGGLRAWLQIAGRSACGRGRLPVATVPERRSSRRVASVPGKAQAGLSRQVAGPGASRYF